MICSCKSNVGREEHLELVNLFFVAPLEIISVVRIDNTVNGMFVRYVQILNANICAGFKQV